MERRQQLLMTVDGHDQALLSVLSTKSSRNFLLSTQSSGHYVVAHADRGRKVLLVGGRADTPGSELSCIKTLMYSVSGAVEACVE